jgi:hypothetical protein
MAPIVSASPRAAVVMSVATSGSNSMTTVNTA